MQSSSALDQRDSLPDDAPRAVRLGTTVVPEPVVAAVRAVAASETHLLLHGEAGSGKRDVAEAIHHASRRSARPFVVLPIAGREPERVRLALFGNDGGGLLDHCRDGTLYLENVDALAPSDQDTLTRALAQPRGSVPRIVAGTHVALETRAETGRFRRDLLALLGVASLHMPPLRDRREDIGSIAECCIRIWADAAGVVPPAIATGALGELQRYGWPGNTRELQRVVERACEMARRGTITATVVQSVLARRPRRRAGAEVAPLQQIEDEYLLASMERCGWNRSLAARRLGIGRNTLLRKLRNLGISRSDAA